MMDFSPHLHALGARLPIPEPVRSRILMEMAADMEDLLQHCLDQGIPPDQARRTVEEQFELADEAIHELVRIHTSPVRTSLEGLSSQARSPWERALLGLVGLLVAAGLVTHLLQPGLLADASLLAYLLLALLAAALGIGLWKAVALRGRGTPANGPAPRRGIRALPALAVLLLGTGFAGVWLELFRVALRIQASPPTALRLLVEWLHMASATLVVALSGAVLTALVWFFLETRAADLDRRAAHHLLGGGYDHA